MFGVLLCGLMVKSEESEASIQMKSLFHLKEASILLLLRKRLDASRGQSPTSLESGLVV